MSRVYVGFIDKKALTLHACNRWTGRPFPAALISVAADGESLVSLIDRAIAAIPPGKSAAKLHLVVQHEQLRTFVVTPPAMATQMADLKSAATLRFKQLFPSEQVLWQIAGTWHASQVFLACAVSSDAASYAEKLVSQGALQSLTIEPWLAACNRALRQSKYNGAWMVQIQAGQATLLARNGPAPAAAIRLPLAPTGLDVGNMVLSAVLQYSLSMPHQLVFFTDETVKIHPAASQDIAVTVLKTAAGGLHLGSRSAPFQFHSAAARRLPSLSAGLALLSIMIASGVLAQRALEMDRGTQKAAHELTAQKAKQRASLKVQPSRLAPDPQAALTQAERNSATRRLNLPWPSLLQALEEVTPPTIALSAISITADGDSIEGTAEAADPSNMLDYIEALQRIRLLAATELIAHEVNQQDPYRPYRFTFRAAISNANQSH